MMIPSISVLEIAAPNGGVIYQAFAQVDGKLWHHEEYVSPTFLRSIPEHVLGRQMRRSVAHYVLEKLMTEVIDPE